MADFNGMLGTTPPPQDPSQMNPSLQMTQVVQPQAQVPPELQPKPVSSPEELEQRKAGWMQVLDNPNFMRAMGVMGAHLAQPRQIGQTAMGQLGQAGMAGSTAFQMGEFAQTEQDRQAKEMAMKQAESGALVGERQSQTALNVARAPGVTAESKVKTETTDALIAKTKAEAEKVSFELKKAKSEEEVDALKRKNEVRIAELTASIPDKTLAAAIVSPLLAKGLEFEKASATLAKTKAETKTEGARQGLLGAQKGEAEARGKREDMQTAHEQITVDVLKAMPDGEKKQFLTKTGPYAANRAGVGATADMYGTIYDGLKKSAPNDPRISGKTREQFQMDGVTSHKQQDASTNLKNYIAAVTAANLDPDSEIVSSLSEQIKQNSQAKVNPGGAAVTTKSTPGKTLAADGSGKTPDQFLPEYQKLKKGDSYIDTKGVERTKQ